MPHRGNLDQHSLEEQPQVTVGGRRHRSPPSPQKTERREETLPGGESVVRAGGGAGEAGSEVATTIVLLLASSGAAAADSKSHDPLTTFSQSMTAFTPCRLIGSCSHRLLAVATEINWHCGRMTSATAMIRRLLQLPLSLEATPAAVREPS